jgi:hypothetical protein
MKTVLLFLSLICLVATAGAQTEQSANKTAAADFEKNYNADDFNAVFNLFDEGMQKALPLDQTKDFLNQLKTNAGKIDNREFIQYDNTFAAYKTTFERALLTLNISVNDAGKINGFSVNAYLPKIERNTTKLMLPFKGEWTVTWGGDTKELNYHVESLAQKNAFDFLITDSKGKSFKTDGKTNEDFYAFGKPLFAPCDGEVVLAVDGVKDNQPGTMNPIYLLGNTVIIKTAKGEYLLFAHFKQHSVLVKQGQQVKQGDQLGQCGNSGNSSEPHLHFHIQNVEDMMVATGIKAYFDKIMVNGQLKKDYSPIKKDRISKP